MGSREQTSEPNEYSGLTNTYHRYRDVSHVWHEPEKLPEGSKLTEDMRVPNATVLVVCGVRSENGDTHPRTLPTMCFRSNHSKP